MPPTSDPSKEETLRRCELLEPLSDAQIEALAERATTRTLREDESLFKQDEESRDLLVVQSGELSIHLKSPTGDEVGRYASAPGCLLGWSAFLTPPTYVSAARATSGGTTVLVISVSEAEEILLREPDAAYQVMKRLASQISGRLRDLREQFIEVMSAR